MTTVRTEGLKGSLISLESPVSSNSVVAGEKASEAQSANFSSSVFDRISSSLAKNVLGQMQTFFTKSGKDVVRNSFDPKILSFISNKICRMSGEELQESRGQLFTEFERLILS